jgi:anti-sigma B factor antagonist
MRDPHTRQLGRPRGISGGASRVVPCGDLDIAMVPELDRALRRANEISDVVVLDLRDLEFVDSCGADLLFEADRRMHAAGAQLVVTHVSAEVGWFLSLTGIDRVLEIEAGDAAGMRPVLVPAA